MGMIRQILIIFFLLIFSVSGYAIGKEVHFKKIDTSEGLNSNVVYSLLQDSKGFLWFGTKEGLNRYDGSKLINYDLPTVPFAKVADKRVNALAEGLDGKIWIGTQLGIVSLNPNNRRTVYYELPYEVKKAQSRYVNAIAISELGEIWIGTRNGLYRFNKLKNQFEQYEYFPFNSKSVSYSKGERLINELCFDKDGKLWIGTAGSGICLLDIVHNKKQFFKRSAKRKEGELTSNFIEDLFQDRNGKMWVATVNGLHLFDTLNESFIVYRHSNEKANSLSDNYVTAISDDRKGNLWIGTKNGLNYFDVSKGIFHYFKHHPMIEKSISSNNILVVLSEKSGSVWLGSMQGINHFSQNNLNFNLYQNIPGNTESLIDNTLRAAVADSKENVWLGNVRHGVSRFNVVKEEFTTIPLGENVKARKRHKVVRTAYLDQEGQVLFGTDGGVLKYNAKKKTLESFPDEKILKFRKGVFEILQDKKGNYWFSELDKGIWKWNPKNNEVELLNKEKNKLSNLNVKLMTQVKNGDIWIACHMRGVCRLKKGESTFTTYRDSKKEGSLSGNRVYSIFQDSKERVWIATDRGLNLYNNISDSFSLLNENNGLPGSVVLSIQEDKLGRLWLGTNKGLSCFDIEKNQFANFFKEDGLQGDIFEYKVACTNKQGLMFFGGNNGLNSFNPSEFVMNTYQPKIRFTSYGVAKNSDEISGNKIKILHTDEDFKLRVAVMSFCEPEKNRIKYRMISADSAWTILPLGLHEISIDKQLVGEYQLEVMASNNHMKWGEPSVLEIVVKRDWKEYFWVIYLFIILILSAVFAIVYLKGKRNKSLQKQKSKGSPKRIITNHKSKKWENYILLLNEFMAKESPYRDKRLTKAQLATQMEWSELQLSNVLREGLQTSFNDFINTYRVNEVKECLKDPKNKDYTLLAIAEDCGFNSKTSFYRTFKRITGKTPSEYMEGMES